jgi:hypothetical protein
MIQYNPHLTLLKWARRADFGSYLFRAASRVGHRKLKPANDFIGCHKLNGRIWRSYISTKTKDVSSISNSVIFRISSTSSIRHARRLPLNPKIASSSTLLSPTKSVTMPRPDTIAPIPPTRNHEWSNSLCSCGPCDICLLGTFLPCVCELTAWRVGIDLPPPFAPLPWAIDDRGQGNGQATHRQDRLTPQSIVLGKTADRMRDSTMQNARTCNSDCTIFCSIQCFTCCGWM